jgi:hypothetical protein
MRRPNPFLAVLAIGTLASASIAEAAPRPRVGANTRSRPILSTDAIARDLIVSCIAEAKVRIVYLTTKQPNKAPMDFAKSLVVQDAIVEAKGFSGNADRSRLDALDRTANEMANAGNDQGMGYFACMVRRRIEIVAGSPLRTVSPPRPLSASMSAPPKLETTLLGLARQQGGTTPMAICDAQISAADITGRSNRLSNNPQQSALDGRRATITLLDETIGMLRPCLADPLAAKYVNEALQMRDQIVGLCRADGMLAQCLAPTAP